MDKINFYVEDISKIFIRFMDLYVIQFTIGQGTPEFVQCFNQSLELENDEGNLVEKFYQCVRQYMNQAISPSVLSIFLNTDFIRASKLGDETQLLEFVLIKHLIEYIVHMDVQSFLSTCNLWSQEVESYARTKFYPNMPQNLVNRCDGRVVDILRF